jgi:hypothetical protein
VQVVQHETGVAVDVPVERCRVDGLQAACDAGGGPELVVEINRGEASRDFPRAPAAALERERVRRLDAAIGRIRRIILRLSPVNA